MSETTDSTYILDSANTYLLTDPNTYNIGTIPIPEQWYGDNLKTTIQRSAKVRRISRTTAGRVLRRSGG